VKPRDPLALGRGEERRGGGGLVDLEGNGRREGEEYAPDEGRWGSNECWTDGPRSGVRWWEGSWPFDAEAKQSETLVRVHPGCQPGISVAAIEIEAEEGKKVSTRLFVTMTNFKMHYKSVHALNTYIQILLRASKYL
jgi:hypothetical protein